MACLDHYKTIPLARRTAKCDSSYSMSSTATSASRKRTLVLNVKIELRNLGEKSLTILCPDVLLCPLWQSDVRHQVTGTKLTEAMEEQKHRLDSYFTARRQQPTNVVEDDDVLKHPWCVSRVVLANSSVYI